MQEIEHEAMPRINLGGVMDFIKKSKYPLTPLYEAITNSFYGDVLDKPENVSDTVDSFKFPDKKETETAVDDLFFNEDEGFLFFDSIKDQVNKVIPSIENVVFHDD